MSGSQTTSVVVVAGVLGVIALGTYSSGGSADRHLETGFKRNVPQSKQQHAAPGADEADNSFFASSSSEAARQKKMPTALAEKGAPAPVAARAVRKSANDEAGQSSIKIDYGPEYTTAEETLKCACAPLTVLHSTPPPPFFELN